MKQFFIVCFLNICAVVTPSFAGDEFLDQELQETRAWGSNTIFKDIFTHQQISHGHNHRTKLSAAEYPPLPIVHPYHHMPIFAPFSAFLEKVSIPGSLAPSLPTTFHGHERVFAFVVQGLEPAHLLTPPQLQAVQTKESGASLSTQQSAQLNGLVYKKEKGIYYALPRYSLKPQYLLEPESPSHDAQTKSHELQWTVVPGQQGRITPEKCTGGGVAASTSTGAGTSGGGGTAAASTSTSTGAGAGANTGLLQDTVSIHPQGRRLHPKFPLFKVSEIPNATERARVTAAITQRGLTPDPEGRFNMDDVNGVPHAKRFSTLVEQRGTPVNQDGLVDMDDYDGVPGLARQVPNFLILSGDSMHLAGIDPHDSADFFSLVAFNKAKPVTAITYHWLLSAADLENFITELNKSRTLRALLENLRSKASFANLLEGLNGYLGGVIDFPVRSASYGTLAQFFHARSQYHDAEREPYESKFYRGVDQYVGLPDFRTYPEDRSLNARIRTAIYAACIGDAMGFIVETDPRQTVEATFPEGLPSFEMIAAQLGPGHAKRTKFSIKGGSQWKTSDDTYFALLMLKTAFTARKEHKTPSLGAILGDTFAALFPNESKKIPGIGADTVKALQELYTVANDASKRGGGWWKRGVYTHEIRDRIRRNLEGGSGAAMRAWTMGIIFHDDIALAAEWGAMQSHLTHSHPTAVAASASIAAGIASALQGEAPDAIIRNMARYAEIWETQASSRVPGYKFGNEVARGILDASASRHLSPRKFFSKVRGWSSKEAVWAATYIFAKDPNNIMEAIYTAVHSAGPGYGTDTDTIAHIVGALVGAHSGPGSLPANWINSIDKKDEIEALVKMLTTP